MTLSRALLAAALTAFVASGAVQAASLTGDEVVATFQPYNIILGPFTAGAGIDYTFGAFTFDVDAGVGGDEFDFVDNGGYFGVNTLVLSSLDFSGGAILTGFELFSTSLANLNWTFDDTTLSFSFDDPSYGPNSGSAIYGRYLTSPAAVPLPASLPLLLGAIGGVGLVRRRRKTVV